MNESTIQITALAEAATTGQAIIADDAERMRLQGLTRQAIADQFDLAPVTIADTAPVVLNPAANWRAPVRVAHGSLIDLAASAADVDELFPTDAELIDEIRRMCAEVFGMDGAATDARMAQFDYVGAAGLMSEELA